MNKTLSLCVNGRVKELVTKISVINCITKANETKSNPIMASAFWAERLSNMRVLKEIYDLDNLPKISGVILRIAITSWIAPMNPIINTKIFIALSRLNFLFLLNC